MVTAEKFEYILIITIIIVAGIMMIYVFQDAIHDYVKEGEMIPQFKILDMNNRILTNNDFAGKIILIDFWASWCPPCVEEMPSLIEFNDKYNNKGVAVLLINVGESIDSINKFLNDNNFKIAVYRDPDGKVSKGFGTYKYPESFIVDRKGILRKKVIGGINWMEENVTGFIQKLIDE